MSGVFWTMATPVTAEVVGLQDLASALSLLWLLGTVIPTICISPCCRVDVDSCRSNRPTVKTKRHFRRENRDRYISGYHCLFRRNDPRWWSYINCLTSSSKMVRLIGRGQRYGYKNNDMENVECIGFGKRPDQIKLLILGILSNDI